MRYILAFVAAVALAMGCATAYTSQGAFGGYTDTQLGPDTWRVNFQGNGYTTEGRTAEFMFRRCAEITLEQGGRFFRVDGEETDSNLGGIGFYGSLWSRPSGDMMFTIIRDGDTEGCYDAIYVIDGTDDAANGNLSEEARAAYDRILLEDPL